MKPFFEKTCHTKSSPQWARYDDFVSELTFRCVSFSFKLINQRSKLKEILVLHPGMSARHTADILRGMPEGNHLSHTIFEFFFPHSNSIPIFY